MGFIVGIDGPAGSGKGTVTKKIANELGLINIDTGITYRCVALEVLNQNVSLEDTDKIIEIARNIKIDIDNKLNKIKLNNLYNFIRKKEKSFDGLTDIDRKAIVTILKRLGLYTEDDSNFPEKFIFELQLKIYAITELYKSSYKVYLNNLTEKMLSLKFLDTEKYCPIHTEEDIVEFMNYFIVCLRNELKTEDKR